MIITSYSFVDNGYKEVAFTIKKDPITLEVTAFLERTRNGKLEASETNLSIEEITFKEKSLMIALVENDIPFKINVWEESDKPKAHSLTLTYNS